MKVSTPVSLNITLVRLGYNWILLWSVKIKLRLACLCWPRKKQNTVLEYSSLHFIPDLQSLFNTDLQFTFYYMHVWHKINESEEWSSQLIFQFKQLERRSLNKIRTSMGFEPVTSSILVRCYHFSLSSTTAVHIWIIFIENISCQKKMQHCAKRSRVT